ncbi:MAG: ferredoxin, partial [Spirochaetes bacterium]
MPEITINNKLFNVTAGTTVLEAAREVEIEIPTLCMLEGKTPQGACRVCLVEVEGSANLLASCSTPVRAGMKIYTNSKKVRHARKTVVELLLSEHHGNCQTCDRSEDCELKALAHKIGIREDRFITEPEEL